MKTIKRHLLPLSLLVLLTGHLECAAATVLSTNLILNSDAESSAGAANYNSTQPLAGWTTTSGFTPVQYFIGGSEDLNSADSAAINGGNNYFAGGPDLGFGNDSSATQRIQFADLAALIDASGLSFKLSGYFGGYSGQDDRMALGARFFDASNFVTGSFSIGFVLAADRMSETQLLFRTTTGTVPAGSRGVDLTLSAARFNGSYNDAYADNLGFEVVPEPASAALLALGGVLCISRRMLRRRERNVA